LGELQIANSPKYPPRPLPVIKLGDFADFKQNSSTASMGIQINIVTKLCQQCNNSPSTLRLQQNLIKEHLNFYFILAKKRIAPSSPRYEVFFEQIRDPNPYLNPPSPSSDHTDYEPIRPSAAMSTQNVQKLRRKSRSLRYG